MTLTLTFVQHVLQTASRLPKPEQAAIKELLICRDPRLISLEFQWNENDFIQLACIEAVSIAYEKWFHLYRKVDCSVDKARNLVAAEMQKDQDYMATTSFVYGEVDFFGFASLLGRLNLQPNQVLVDLGHGTGRALLAANLLYPDLHLIGIELMEVLYDISCYALHEYQQHLDVTPPIVFMNGDLREIDWWSTSDIVFVNGTAFTDSLWNDVLKLACHMRPDTRFITLTKSFEDQNDFELLEKYFITTSWGLEPVFIHKRTSYDVSSL